MNRPPEDKPETSIEVRKPLARRTPDVFDLGDRDEFDHRIAERPAERLMGRVRPALPNQTIVQTPVVDQIQVKPAPAVETLRPADIALAAPTIDWPRAPAAPAIEFQPRDPFIEPAARTPCPKNRIELCPPEPAGYRWTWIAVATAIIVLYALMLLTYWAPAHPGVDQNGYLVGGRQFAKTFSTGYAPPDPFAFVGNMWVKAGPKQVVDPKTGQTTEIAQDVYFPKYPLGLPILYALTLWAAGMERGTVYAFAVSPACMVVAMAGMFLLARRLTGSFVAVLAVILLATSQVTLTLANNPNSHASCMAFVVWGMYFLVRWWESGGWYRGAAAGFLVGYAFTIRYTEGLLGLPVGLAALFTLPSLGRFIGGGLLLSIAAAAGYVCLYRVGPIDAATGAGSFETLVLRYWGWVLLAGAMAGVGGLVAFPWKLWRSLLRASAPVLAWLVPVVGLLLWNKRFIGDWTGYDSTNESEFGRAFTWGKFTDTWEQSLRTLHDTGLFFILPLAVAGMFMMFRRSWKLGVVMIAWLVPSVALYTSYYWSPERGTAYARFFMSVFPAAVLSAAYCIRWGILSGLDPHGPTGDVASAPPGPTHRSGDSDRHVIHINDIKSPDLNVPASAPVRAVPAATGWRRGGFALPIAAGVVVAISSGVGAYRSVWGMEDGRTSGQALESQQRQNVSLGVVGRMAGRHVAAGSVLFGENDRMVQSAMNYLQFVVDADCYVMDAFTTNGGRRFRGPADPNDANPLQPRRREFYAALYESKSDGDLIEAQNRIMDAAMASGRRVYVMGSPTTLATFKARYAPASKYELAILDRWKDLPEVRDADGRETTPAPPANADAPRRQNRLFGGARNVPAFDPLGRAPQSWQLAEVKRKPAPVRKTPSTKPATQP